MWVTKPTPADPARRGDGVARSMGLGIRTTGNALSSYWATRFFAYATNRKFTANFFGMKAFEGSFMSHLKQHADPPTQRVPSPLQAPPHTRHG